MWIQRPTLGSFRRIIRAGGRAGGGKAGCGSVCNAYRPGPAPRRRASHRLGISVPPPPAPGLLRENSSGRRHSPAASSIPGTSRRSLPRSPAAGAGDAVVSFAWRPWGEPPPQPTLCRPQQGLPPEGLLCRPRPPPARLPASTHHITDGGDVSDSH